MILKLDEEYTFVQLVRDLSDVLGPSSGIDSDDVDPHELQRLMSKYVSLETEWKHYALSDPSRNYTRNLVDEGNGKSNLLILVWNPGKTSPIHDHANAHCVMKILKGSLKETLYSNPPADKPCALNVKQETTYLENEVTYISDNIGLHKIANPSDTEQAISLHLYTPPHAANYGFNLFNEETGSAIHVKQATLFSNHGKIIENTNGGCF